MNEMSKNENLDIQIYNFAYLDENTKRMIRRALLKACLLYTSPSPRDPT